MSSKQLVYLLMVLVVCCSVAGGIAHGQSGNVTFKGTVLIDDSPAPGITITAENSAGVAGLVASVESREDGSYVYGWINFTAVVNAGDTFTFTLTDSEGNSQETAPYTLTAADIAVPFTVDLDLVPVSAGITVQSGLSALPADGTSTSTITAMVRDDSGNPAAGDTVTISADKGTVGATTDNGDGTYTATYTAPSLALAASDTAQISAASAQLGETAMTSITLTPIPTTVTVTVDPSIFSADTQGTGKVTISVDRAGPVADETVTISTPTIGTVGAVTNNGDGTYSATYTSGAIAGRVTLTATATQADESGSAIITISAGVPAEVTVSAVPTGVSSGGSAIITAMVSDSSGNALSAQSLTAETSSGSGTITEFTESSARSGSYSATYTAPVVTAEGTETITVTVGTASGQTTLQLTPVPPVEVGILEVEGTVFTVDGVTPVAGVKVEVTVGSNTEMGTTDMDGAYLVTFLDLLMPAARGGDPVSIVVTDANDGTHGPYTSVLSNDELGEGGTATVRRDVTTDIPVPPRTVNILVVNGIVYTIDGETPAEGVNVTVTVGSNALAMTTTDMNGFFERTAVGLDTPAASTGDMVSIVVTDSTGTERGAAELTLTSADLGTTGSATVTQNVMTDIVLPPMSVDILVVDGVVYRDDMMTPVDSGFDVTVTVGADESQTTSTDADGSFSVTFLEIPPMTVATTGDMVLIIVTDSTGTQRGPGDQFTLTHIKLADPTVTRKVYTDIGATSKLLNVVGTVYLKDGDGDPVPAARHLRQTELTVVVANSVRNLEQRVPVDDNGEYAATLISFLDIAAETGDSLTVAVEDDAGVTVGEMAHTLTTPEVQVSQAMVNVHTDVPAKVGVLSLVGSVVELDGTAAGAGLQVTITLAMDGQTMPPMQVSTDASGGYEYTFFDPPATIATTGDVLMVDVLRSVDGYHGHAEIDPLRSIEIIYRNQPLVVDPIKMLPPIKALGGLSINPQYVPEELKRISREAIQTNPVLLEMIPSGILYLDLMKGQLASLPAGFDPTNDAISKANFGNAIAPKPIWHVLGQDRPTDPNRWLNGDLLNLYVLTGPTADSVMFTLSGGQSGRASATRIAAGDTVPYTFQLEEERAVLFLPSWDGLNEGMSVFASVDLVIDGDAGIPMTPNMDTGIWEAEAQLMPGSKVYYHYRVRLAHSYEVDGRTVENWVVPDPRNLQVEDRGIVETLLAPELGPDLVEIVTTTNLQLRSVLDVPAANALQSLWVQTFDLTGSPDGMYQLDTVITHADTVITTDRDYAPFVETIGTQAFMVDRSAPTADLTIEESLGWYQNPDGSYVAAAHADSGTLTITATPTGDPMDPGAYLYQIISLDAAGNPGVNVWNPATLTTDLALTYMEPHQVTLPISGENSLLGNFGLRAVGINDILNISSSTAPIMLEVVPLAYDNAAVTVVHADYNGDGTRDGRFESVQHVSDGVTIFSDRSAVTLTLEITERTKHPLTSIAVDFQIDGAGAWMPIHVFDADALTDVAMGSKLTVSWDRTEDFADLLDMRGQATVRVTVANALDAVSADSMATFEIVPPALQLGGLSINTSYEAGLNALQGLGALDVTAMATSLLGMDPSALISPSPLPVALALLGVLGHVQSALPAGFETADEQIHRENFGNAITPKPIWSFMASADQQDSGRWINSNQLSLYTFAGPTAQSLTFSITGAGSDTATAEKVAAGGSFMYNFQLEEELVAIFAGSMPAFAAVTLMIDGQAPIAMVGNAGVWSAEAPLTPGYTVSYYYRVELAQPYHDPINQLTITAFPLPDPRNLQMAETANLLETIEMLLTSELNPLATMDPGLRSVFRVPAVDDDSQSLWVGKLNLPADGMYQLDVAVGYSGGSADALTGKMFTVDTTAPTADTMVHDTPDDNIGMYLRDADGTYVATALPDPGRAILNVSATPIDDSDLETYLYQFARLDDAGKPGTWNPMLTVDLQALDIAKLLTNPASVLPLTSRPPHHVQMLVRSETENDLDYGTYGLRVVGIDNILNADSGRAAGVVLELVSPDPDSAMISLVQTDYDGNGTTDGPYETQSTAGEVTIFSDSMVTLTVDIIERSDHPLTIELEYQIAGGDWHPIGTLSQADLVNAMEGDQLTVNWDVGDYAALPNLTGEVMVRTVATNALTIRRQTDATFTYQRRLAPAINAIHVEAADLHPDSGAPRDGITISAFTQAMTNPVTTAVEFEVRRSQGTDWVPVGTAQLAGTTVVSQVQIAIIEDLVGAVVGGAASAPIAPFYRQWSISVDTTTLEDTILDDTPAASDASQDDNPYVVRAIAVDAANAAYPSADGVTDSFSVDNYSPTEITEVANEVEVVAPREVEDGQVSGNGPYYRVSGLLLKGKGVPEPMLTLTARTGAYPGVFPGGIKLAITDASSGATLGVDTVFEDAGNYTYEGVVNLASIPNGIYNVMAVAHAADGSPETRIVPMPIIVEVRNFTPPENFANPSVDIVSIIDTEGDARSPSEIDALYPIGFPTIDDKLTFTLTVSNVDADEIDVLIGDDERSARMLGALTDDGIMITVNPDGSISFEIMLDTSMLDEGPFDLTGTVTKPNGTARFGLPVIRVDRSAPVVEIVSPVSRHQIDMLPAIQITYTDASGFDPNDMAMNTMPVEITLTRLPGGEAINVDVSRIRITAATAGEILSQSGNIVYTHDYDLAGGAYRIEATVTDILGNVGTAAPVEFTVESVRPTVSIVSPLIGVIVDPKQPLIISAALTGNGEITVTEFQINGTDMEGTLENNWLTYTMQPPLIGAADSILQRGSDNTISVKIVDSEDRTAEGAISFAVSLDSTPPVISGPSPESEVTRELGRIAAQVSDNESNITRIQLAIDDNPLQDISFSPAMTVEVEDQTGFSFADAPLGTHSVTLVAESTGGSSALTWTFTIVAPEPTVTIVSPLVGEVVDPGQPLIVSADLTGAGEITVTEFQINGMDMEGTLADNSLSYTMQPPLVNAADSILQRGSDNTISVKIVDSENRTAESTINFAVAIVTPTVTIVSPLVGEVVDPGQPLIVSAELTGAGELTVTEFQINGTDMEGTFEGNWLSYTMQPPLIDAADSILQRGSDNTISVKMVDAEGNTAESTTNFAVTIAKPTVTIITPAPGQVIDADQPLIISAAFSGSGEITVDQLLINGGTYTPQSVKGNLLTHTIQPPFGVLFKRGSGNRITIKIVDEEGNTAEATSNFAISKDVTPPVVATYSPLGIIRTDRPIAAATVTDASGINTRSLTIIIAGVPGNQGTGRRSSKTSTTVTFTPSISVTPGPYTARVTVEDVHGNRTEAEWQFTVELDVTPPSITISSPHGVIRSDKPIISVSASDDMSGVDTIEIGVKGEGNQTVAGVTSVRSDKTSATFTPAASLTSGTYTVDVKLADMRGNKASGQWQFTVELDTIPPAITITRPMQEHTENRRPIISASYTDVLSGVDAESVKISLDGSAIEPDAVSETQVMFTPEFDLTFGQHTVKLEVSDLAPSANTAVQEWSFFVERMGIANARNYPNPFEDDTTIAFRISRQASITVQIYDFTGRLVAEPISNSVREAGPVEIPWDGQTNAGDSLARGVYFCHILMESELEPQSTILKMAIISD